MIPSSYRFDELAGRSRLYLGGLTTLDGLRFFSRDAVVENCKFHTNDQAKHLEQTDVKDVMLKIASLASADGHTGLVDFSCVVDGRVCFSTHDDCECHFEADTLAEISKIVKRVTAEIVNVNVWRTLQSHPACYVEFQDDGSFTCSAEPRV